MSYGHLRSYCRYKVGDLCTSKHEMHVYYVVVSVTNYVFFSKQRLKVIDSVSGRCIIIENTYANFVKSRQEVIDEKREKRKCYHR